MIHLTETRERFFRAITKEIPVDEIAEIHFFQPMRQGGVESGVAVVASRDVGTGTKEEGRAPESEVDENGVSSREERERLAEAARRYVTEHCAPQKVADQYLNVLHAVRGQKHRDSEEIPSRWADSYLRERFGELIP